MSLDILREENERLHAHVRELQARLGEPEETIRAIRDGEIDAVVVAAPEGERVLSLRTADVLYRAMVQGMGEGALVIDDAGLIMYCNPYFSRLLGLAQGSLIGTPMSRLVSDESRSSFESISTMAPAGGHGEFVLIAAGDEEIPVYASLNHIVLETTRVAILIVTDLRSQLQRQEMLAESARKDEFLAMLAHELRNPLAPIRNALTLMNNPAISQASLDWSRQVIERHVAQLVRLLDDLLDVQRFVRGIIDLETELTEIGSIIEHTMEAIRPSIDAKHQVLRVQRAPVRMYVLADGARMTQVLSNLLINAVKYSPADSWVSVEWEEVGSFVHIRIADNGIGMSPELLRRVFDPFVQGHRDLSRSEGGLGLGLTLVRRLVELHGGRVKATSAGVGRGSEFTVVLPLVSASRDAESETPPVESMARTPRRVLVVDDNEDAAASLCALLHLAGHQAWIARDGAEALRHAPQFKPEIVILDIGLPGMDGYEVARRLLVLESCGTCKIIALSGYGRAEDRELSLAAGFCAHLVKPVIFEEVLDAIASACGCE